MLRQVSYSTNGFDASITLSDKRLVFFSVPYDDGWKAQVNGRDVDIIKVDFGFMAVACEEGENTIHFTYKTRYLNIGLCLTGSGFVVWTGYVVFFRRREKLAQAAANDDDDNGGSDDTQPGDEQTEDLTGDTDEPSQEDLTDNENSEAAAEGEENDVLKGD